MPEERQTTQILVPETRPGWVLVKVRALGVNHSEQILCLIEIEADYIQKPIIPGIKCVGEIADPSDSEWAVGQKVAALMGGMGRNFHSSYAQYALLPAHHVFAVDSKLDWTHSAIWPIRWTPLAGMLPQ